MIIRRLPAFSLFVGISRRFASRFLLFHDICVTVYIMGQFFSDFHDMDRFADIADSLLAGFHDMESFADIVDSLLAGFHDMESFADIVDATFSDFHGIDGFCVYHGIFAPRLPRDRRFLRIPWKIPSPASTGSAVSAHPVEYLLAGSHGIDGFCVYRGIFHRRLPRDRRFLRIPWTCTKEPPARVLERALVHVRARVLALP